MVGLLTAASGTRGAAVGWTCSCGMHNLAWQPCEACYSDMPRQAVRSAIDSARPVLDAPPDAARAEGSAEAGAFRRGVVDAYAVGRAGLLPEPPTAFRLCHNELPKPPLPSPALAALLKGQVKT